MTGQEASPERWRLERYDASWGGWRSVPKSTDSEEPAEYGSEKEAEAVARLMSRGDRRRYRVRKVQG